MAEDISKLPDTELVSRAQQGDQKAFRELVTRYENRIYRLALKMLRDEQDAEDVLQETFISVYRHLDSFRGNAEFAGFPVFARPKRTSPPSAQMTKNGGLSPLSGVSDTR